MDKEKKEENSLLKIILITLLSLLIFGFFSSVFFSNNPGYSGRRMMHGMMDNNYSTSNGLSNLLEGFLSVSMHLLWVFSLVALIFGLFVLTKKAFEQKHQENQKSQKSQKSQSNENNSVIRFQTCPECGDQISDDFKFCPNCTTSLTKKCICGNRIQVSWKCCPYCGRKFEY